MFDAHSDLGAALFKTWTEQQRIDEIGKLVAGFRNGIPVGILCRMSETIAGDRKKAKKILKQLLTPQERQNAVNAAEGGMLPLVRSFME
jgi:hypothetical protein